MPAPPPRFWLLCLGVFALGFGARLIVDDLRGPSGSGGTVADAALDLVEGGDVERTTAVYGGVGTWIDAFDLDPAYQRGGGAPALAPDVVDAMADAGVETIYVQAARRDDAQGSLVLDEAILGELLARAHARGLFVVGWYLPYFDDVAADLERLGAIADFAFDGHRFDGVAVDIEYIEAVPDATVRSARLVELSRALRERQGDEVLGAIVPPAAQLEVVNPSYWPSFPWRELADVYDVWMPMAYWSVRDASSPYRDPYTYAEESTRRMQANLGQPSVVHLIGGIGDGGGSEAMARFGEALTATGAIGGSLYDWNAQSAQGRAGLASLGDALGG